MENQAECDAGATATIYFDTTQEKALWRGPRPVCLNFHETLSISFAGFPSGSQLTEVVFRAKGRDEVIRWTPGETIDGDIFSVNLTSGSDLLHQQLSIQDVEQPKGDDTYHLAVHGHVGGTSQRWHIDPEVINQGGHVGPGKPKF